MEKKKKIRLRDIAKIAKVSPATASFVLNNKQHQGISDRTWQKIEKIAKKYGYNKNIKANNSQKKYIFFMEEFASNPNVSQNFFLGFNNADFQNYEFLFFFNKFTNDTENIKKITNIYNPSGIIIANSYTKKINYDLNNIKTNKILLNCWSDNFNGITILPDDYNGSKTAVRFLLKSGFKRIGIVMSEAIWMQAYTDRLNGWRDAHIEARIAVDQKLIVKLTYKNPDVESQETNLGYNSFNYFIKNKIKIDAIFCTNDLLALGCYQAIKETNLNIPNDISIIGYDNSQIATNIKPELTSVELPYKEMTQKAINQLINFPNIEENYKIYVECPLINHNSVKINKDETRKR
jgi:LacI family transcriptional regulator